MTEKELNRELRLARKKAELSQIKRKSLLNSASEFISFATRKLSAVSLVGLGGVEIFSPEIVTAVQLSETSSIAAITIGLGILGGKQLSDSLNRMNGGGDD